MQAKTKGRGKGAGGGGAFGEKIQNISPKTGPR